MVVRALDILQITTVHMPPHRKVDKTVLKAIPVAATVMVASVPLMVHLVVAGYWVTVPMAINPAVQVCHLSMVVRVVANVIIIPVMVGLVVVEAVNRVITVLQVVVVVTLVVLVVLHLAAAAVPIMLAPIWTMSPV